MSARGRPVSGFFLRAGTRDGAGIFHPGGATVGAAGRAAAARSQTVPR